MSYEILIQIVIGRQMLKLLILFRDIRVKVAFIYRIQILPIFVFWILITFDKMIKKIFVTSLRNKILLSIFTNTKYGTVHSLIAVVLYDPKKIGNFNRVLL